MLLQPAQPFERHDEEIAAAFPTFDGIIVEFDRDRAGNLVRT